MSLSLDRNLLALSANAPELSKLIAAATPSSNLFITTAKSGVKVPYVRRADGDCYLHSRFDPVREGERLAETSGGRGFFVFFGLGAAYHILPFLRGDRCSGALIVDYDLERTRALFESLDLTATLADRRVRLLVDPDSAELEAALAGRYIPVLLGDLSTIAQRAIVDLDPEAFSRAMDTVLGAIRGISDDYSVQAFFGRRWFLNTVRNLFVAERSVRPLPPVRKAVVCAAGPSLEQFIKEISDRQRKGQYIIATDTSFPALERTGIMPDAIVSIDCQHISYYHFMRRVPSGVPLVLDLASPHVLTRRAECLHFFSSGHPFCRFVAERFRPFPFVDTSGGNVTYAAMSFAQTLGAERVALFGADFSYPYGKSYARGTYIYPYFDGRISRLRPQESHFQAFMFRNAQTVRQTDNDGSFRYVTKPLSAYRAALESFIARSPMIVEHIRGDGVRIELSGAAERTSRARETRLFGAGRALTTARDFLLEYRSFVSALKPPSGSISEYLNGLEALERDVLTTLLPAAAAIKRERGFKDTEWIGLISETARWTMETIDSST